MQAVSLNLQPFIWTEKSICTSGLSFLQQRSKLILDIANSVGLKFSRCSYLSTFEGTRFKDLTQKERRHIKKCYDKAQEVLFTSDPASPISERISKVARHSFIQLQYLDHIDEAISQIEQTSKSIKNTFGILGLTGLVCVPLAGLSQFNSPIAQIASTVAQYVGGACFVSFFITMLADRDLNPYEKSISTLKQKLDDNHRELASENQVQKEVVLNM